MIEFSSDEAQRAIYVDFESLKTTGSPSVKVGPVARRPALLGVLFGADGEDLEQLIIDERFAPARKAKPKQTPVVSAAEAVDTILNLARANDVRIVGWSNFDRDRMIEIRPDLGEEITKRYVNALKLARRWRVTVHPLFPIEREDQFAAKHTLDKYALLAQYRQAHRLDGAEPAKWIRHVLEQLKATDGNYRRTTRETKRDWHKLLEYNRHDLLALRHITLRAARELGCWRAYERTRFCVEDGSRRICFMVGSRNSKLDALVARHHARRWAFIAASNPNTKRLSHEENIQRHAQLTAMIHSLGFGALAGEGIGEDPAWTPERSLMVLGISEGKARSIGRHFRQLAIVVGRRGERSRLVSTDG